MFAAIIRSDANVRQACSGHFAANIWWMIILALHGKPVKAGTDPDQMLKIVANGFCLRSFQAIL